MNVARALVLVALATALVMGTRCFPERGGATRTRNGSAIDQVAFAALDGEAQRLYRTCLDGLGEAEDMRSRTGEWPTVAALAARGITPFARDPLDRAGYHWTLAREGTELDYEGIPDDRLRPTFIIGILEPDPGTPIDPIATTDEQHHKLRDGKMLHVGIWVGARTLDRATAMPRFEDGWRRVTMATP
jgi:hypothetical protein